MDFDKNLKFYGGWEVAQRPIFQILLHGDQQLQDQDPIIQIIFFENC